MRETGAVQSLTDERRTGSPIESHAFEEEMIMSRQFYRLSLVHQRLDELIRREQRFPVPNPFRLMRLKRMKLAIKDRLFALARKPARA